MKAKTQREITVFVVDDSSYMRALITDSINAAQGMRCVGEAADPAQARQRIKDTNPDVLTLDIEMPGMNGLEFLQKIMRLRPMPVIMVSSLTRKGADITMQALAEGAVDCLAKPGGDGDISIFRHNIAEKIRIASLADIHRSPALTPVTSPSPPALTAKKIGVKPDLIAIGSSTGGVEALSLLVPALGTGIPPVVVTQHMPPSFTASLALRLDSMCQTQVKEAEHGEIVRPGIIYIAQGGKQCRVITSGAGYALQITDNARVSGHCPSVDALFTSVAETAGNRAAGIILTGMGNDGAAGLKMMRDAGCPTFGQDEATCLIYGMPRAAFDAQAVERQLGLNAIAPAVLRLVR